MYTTQNLHRDSKWVIYKPRIHGVSSVNGGAYPLDRVGWCLQRFSCGYGGRNRSGCKRGRRTNVDGEGIIRRLMNFPVSSSTKGWCLLLVDASVWPNALEVRSDCHISIICIWSTFSTRPRKFWGSWWSKWRHSWRCWVLSESGVLGAHNVLNITGQKMTQLTRECGQKKPRKTKINCCVFIAGSPSQFQLSDKIYRRIRQSWNSRGRERDVRLNSEFNEPLNYMHIKSKRFEPPILIINQRKERKKVRKYNTHVLIIVPAQTATKSLKKVDL